MLSARLRGVGATCMKKQGARPPKRKITNAKQTQVRGKSGLQKERAWDAGGSHSMGPAGKRRSVASLAARSKW